MKKTIFAAAAFCFVGTSGFACSAEDSNALSSALTQTINEVVALDEANLGKVMGLMQQVSVKEYHEGPFATICARKTYFLDMVTDLSDQLGVEQSAMLQQ